VAVRRRIAHFNKRVVNPIQRRWAHRLPPWAVVVHRGRISGRRYETPVLAHIHDGEVVIALFYGVGADWVRNVVAAGGGELIRRRRTLVMTAPRIEGVRLVADITGG
jgi:deazaflavin-dependent oxidoreductase (nitroreductase family)